MTDKVPLYVYKLVPSTASFIGPIIPERLPVSDIDQKSGFIHLSTAFQVPNTLKGFFKDEPIVYVLRILYENVEHDIRWESPEGSVCGPRPNEGLFPVSFSCLSVLPRVCFLVLMDWRVALVQRTKAGSGRGRKHGRVEKREWMGQCSQPGETLAFILTQHGWFP